MAVTWNPADKNASITLSGGDLVASNATVARAVRATAGKSSGKWYWEITCATPYLHDLGIGNSSASLSQYVGQNANSWGYTTTGHKYNNAVETNVGTAFTNHVMGFKLDMDAGTLEILKADVSIGTIWTGLTGTIYPMVSGNSGSTAGTITANFGASAFTYSIPSGYTAFGAEISVATGIAATTAFGTPVLVPSAVGFSSTQFGTPAYIGPQFVDATGFSSTVFGTPAGATTFGATSIDPTTAFGLPTVALKAAGISSTVFGIPSTPLFATGFSSTVFGTPSTLTICVASALSLRPQFGTPWTRTDRIVVASGASTTAFGRALAWRTNPRIRHLHGHAYGLRSVSRFGTPSIPLTVTGIAPATAFGTPTYPHSAAGFSGTVFGAPALIPSAVGFSSTVFGTPTI